VADKLNNQMQIMHQQVEDDARMDREAVVAPDNFKVGMTWKVSAEALETDLMQILGFGHVPLKYLIHKEGIPNPNTIYQTDRPIAKNCTAPLSGRCLPMRQHQSR
jgi:hypothetical protein